MFYLNEITYWGNSPKEYAVAVGIVIIAVILFQIFKGLAKRAIYKKMQQTDSRIGDLILRVIRFGVLPLLYIVALYIAVNTLSLSVFMKKAIDIAMAVVTVFFVVRILIMTIQTALEYYLEQKGRKETKNALSGVLLIVQIVLWTFGLVFLLGNLGYGIGSILAGLGIGGIAIALAAQNILADIFAYFSILFDKPYEVGDFLIMSSGELGTVTHIGIKTTRIQSLSGEELIYSNKNMLDQWIHNYNRMEKRRAVFDFYVSYETSPAQLKKIPEEVKKIINAQNKVLLDRVHFFDFGEYGLHFQGVYYSMEPGYGAYRDKQQNINLSIMELLEKMDVQFAFATNREVSLKKKSE